MRNNAQIKRIALTHGFKLKNQPDGKMELNPYVYEFAKALLLVKLQDIQDDMYDLTDETYLIGSNPELDACDAIVNKHIDELRSGDD